MKRIVHLDLKGAPIKIPYLEKVLISAKCWGATGILLEWEDTFPYSGDLEVVGSRSNSSGDEMYSLEEVKHILQFTKDNGLEAIQLVQTMSHMEFVLKHPSYMGLRENARSPAVLCPSKPQSQWLIQALLQQLLDVQPDAKYLHIGADEVWHTAVCVECKRRSQNNQHKEASLFLDHVRDTALFLKQKCPELTVLMWDDMLRFINIDALTAYDMGRLVEPVVWHYNPMESFRIDRGLWQNYGLVFPRVWAGSAFKGANGSCQVFSSNAHYVSNHEAWVREIRTNSEDVDFAGIILTGWSRFDHYAALCELLPVSMSSLESCLEILTNFDNTPREITQVELADSQGEDMTRNMHTFVLLRDRCTNFLNGDMVTTWLNPWQIENQYTTPIHMESIVFGARSLHSELLTMQEDISKQLQIFTGKRSATEWIQTYIAPTLKKLYDLFEVAQTRAQKDAGVRPAGLLST